MKSWPPLPSSKNGADWRRIPALLAVASGLSAGGTWLRIRDAERRFPPRGRFLDTGDSRLHYIEKGNGDPVVLLHGNPGFAEDYALTIMDELALDFHAVAFDRPGHGYSERGGPGPMTAEAQTRRIHDALVRLGIVRPVLVGHSWSGSIVLNYAIAYPEDLSGVVLLGAMTHPVPAGSPGRARLFASPVLGHAARWVVWPWFAPEAIRENLVQAYAPDPVRSDHAAVAAALWSRPGQVRAAAEDQLSVEASLGKMVPLYPTIKVPVTVLVGDQDPWCDTAIHVQPLAEAISQARVITLERTGHELAHTRPSAVIEAIRAVWAESRG
jgi:pimeloyl-ACP methyl ester carboxylesterase